MIRGRLRELIGSGQPTRTKLVDDLRAYIRERDNYTCQRCGCKLGEVCSLHLAPVSRLDVAHIDSEGPYIAENLRLLCHPCNQREGYASGKTIVASNLDDWFAQIQELRNTLP